MPSIAKKGRLWYLALVAAIILVIAIGLEAAVPVGTWLDFAVRGLAIYAYITLFVSIVSAYYMRELVRFFGQSFIKVHHIATLTALGLIALHPTMHAIRVRSIAVFVPSTRSWFEFFANGGRVALYLFGLAALAAVLRRAIVRNWRVIHWLSYIGFLFATVHGVLVGSDLQSPPARIVAILMAVAVVGTFVLKRRTTAKRPARPSGASRSQSAP